MTLNPSGLDAIARRPLAQGKGYDRADVERMRTELVEYTRELEEELFATRRALLAARAELLEESTASLTPPPEVASAEVLAPAPEASLRPDSAPAPSPLASTTPNDDDTGAASVTPEYTVDARLHTDLADTTATLGIHDAPGFEEFALQPIADPVLDATPAASPEPTPEPPSELPEPCSEPSLDPAHLATHLITDFEPVPVTSMTEIPTLGPDEAAPPRFEDLVLAPDVAEETLVDAPTHTEFPDPVPEEAPTPVVEFEDLVLTPTVVDTTDGEDLASVELTANTSVSPDHLLEPRAETVPETPLPDRQAALAALPRRSPWQPWAAPR